MNDRGKTSVFCCNGASPPKSGRTYILDYRPGTPAQNIRIGLPRFVRDVYHIPDRRLDLLEIAAYVFSADRLIERGRKHQLEYQSWSRRFRYRIRVRDQEFWSRQQVLQVLGDCLRFMTGDASYEFEFLPGHSTPATSLFDVKGFAIDDDRQPVAVTLFSGGLDSLAGVVRELSGTNSRLVLVSHQSQPGTKRTQHKLIEALRSRFGERVHHYKFECNLREIRAAEETQRTRSFLYASIGFAIAAAYGQDSLSIYENGVTSANLRRREDLANARASRTTHPQTIARLSELFSLILDRPFEIKLPFIWETKTEVLRDLDAAGGAELIASAVSCSRTFQRLGEATHCGKCFQCVDRRFAVHAASLEKWDDPGLYAADMIAGAIDDPEARTTAIDYVRQAQDFARGNVDHFYDEYLSELAALAEYLPGTGTELDRIEKIWRLMRRHGEAVGTAIRRMRDLYDDPFEPLQHRSLLRLISEREHLKPEVLRAVESVSRIVGEALPQMFRGEPPRDERDLNRKIGALIKSHEPSLRSEHPTVSFACAHVIPDHELERQDLLIESKYVRGGTTPSKASDGMAADLTKYPNSSHILFLVYDPDGAIVDGEAFRGDFESKGRCSVRILR